MPLHFVANRLQNTNGTDKLFMICTSGRPNR
jgi:hypothetical protein